MKFKNIAFIAICLFVIPTHASIFSYLTLPIRMPLKATKKVVYAATSRPAVISAACIGALYYSPWLRSKVASGARWIGAKIGGFIGAQCTRNLRTAAQHVGNVALATPAICQTFAQRALGITDLKRQQQSLSSRNNEIHQQLNELQTGQHELKRGMSTSLAQTNNIEKKVDNLPERICTLLEQRIR